MSLASANTADHPRSRGVYTVGLGSGEWGCGSSPLARGLPQPGGHLRDSRGIIPARAGFTRVITREEEKSPDHPRSRGVYAPVGGPDEVGVGSSPLARGLPRTVEPTAAALRIIPAHAGFTWFRRRVRWACADHPRSRGVYRSAAAWAAVSGGSSPLARGLPGGSPRRPRGRWIIPARAGFTSS